MIGTSPEAVHGSAAEPVIAARALLARFGEPDPVDRYLVAPSDRRRALDATATAVMDLYRKVGGEEVYSCLVELALPSLSRRVRCRTRDSGLDAAEVLQDVLINVYRYPDRFDGARAGAFRAWSAMIVDNTIRRQLRQKRRGPDVVFASTEVLSCEPDARAREPDARAQASEACRDAFHALRWVLTFYMAAYEGLTPRERYVLRRVEIDGLRYAPLASELGIRTEALKMVVFRARRRIADRIARMLR